MNASVKEPDVRWQRHAAEWGIASLAIGGVLVLASPMTLVLSAQVWAHSDRTAEVVLLHAWLARVGVGVALLLAITGLGCGVKALHLAFVCEEPAGLAFGGLVVSLAGCLLWVITAVALLNTTESLLILYR